MDESLHTVKKDVLVLLVAVKKAVLEANTESVTCLVNMMRGTPIHKEE